MGKSTTEMYNLLTEVCGDECLLHTPVLECLEKFKELREDVRDNLYPNRPCTVKTGSNIEKVNEIV